MIKLRNFWRDESGLSATEFAIIAPVLATAFLGVAEVGHIAYQRTDMHGALRSGGQYVLNGGRDLEVAQDIISRSWTSMPEDGLIEATRYCLCSDDEHVCNAPCDDNSVPEAYITLRARATLGGIVVDHSEAADDAIRIR